MLERRSLKENTRLTYTRRDFGRKGMRDSLMKRAAGKTRTGSRFRSESFNYSCPVAQRKLQMRTSGRKTNRFLQKRVGGRFVLRKETQAASQKTLAGTISQGEHEATRRGGGAG